LSEYFARRAKAILEIELDEPQVATVQGLVVLSSYEAAATRDTRAWVFSGKVEPFKHMSIYNVRSLIAAAQGWLSG
jgi:hypothetical protein